MYRIFIFFVAIAFSACSAKRMGLMRNPSSTAPPETLAIDENLFGGGVNVPGKGNFSVPTPEAVVFRLQNGLEQNVTSASGNFALALSQVKKNLPQVTNPIKATGFDQVQLLVYGACSDLTTGAAPLMMSKYRVNPAQSIATNKANLISAGMQMLDHYTANLASQSTATAKIQEALTKLTNQLAGVSGNTSVIAFMSVCITANTVGTTLLGF